MLVVDCENSCVRFESLAMSRHLNDVVEELKRFLKEYGVTDISGPSVVLLELLKNAVNHGCKENGNSMVYALIEHLSDNEFKIVVEDEGKGFDYQALDFKLPEDPRKISSRGYRLINALSNRLEFNEYGNRVTAYISTT